MTDVRKATHVKTADGLIHKIASKWGISKDGQLARIRDGGFGVITTDGLRIDMFNAHSYLRIEEPNDTLVEKRTDQI